MEISDNPLIGSSVKDSGRIIESLRNNTPVKGVYLICLSQDAAQASRSLLEILHAADIRISFYAKRRYMVIALAGGKTEAFQMVKTLVEGYLSERADYDFTDFKGWLQ